jgi:hypothetical protein
MTAAVITLLCLMLALMMPIAIKGSLRIKGMFVQAQMRLYWAFAPVVHMRACVGVLPLRYERELSILGIKAPQPQPTDLQKKDAAKKKPSYQTIRALASAFRPRTLRARLDFGLAQDPAATALGYGLIQGTVQAIFSRLQAGSDADCQAEIHAHFQQTRLEGDLDGIFQTTLAHIIVSAIKAWRSQQ